MSVKIKKVKQPKVKEIKSNIQILKNKKEGRDASELEEELEQTPQLSSRGSSQLITPTLRSTPQSTSPTENVERLTQRQNAIDSEEERDTSYSPRSDAAIYTAIATQDNVTRYTMHSGARADQRVAISRPGESTPVLGQARTIGGERVIGQPTTLQQSSPLRQNAFEEDRRYGLYKEENNLNDANRVRARRR